MPKILGSGSGDQSETAQLLETQRDFFKKPQLRLVVYDDENNRIYGHI
jgi:hypothetical protein